MLHGIKIRTTVDFGFDGRVNLCSKVEVAAAGSAYKSGATP
jgi:hypothetical protein